MANHPINSINVAALFGAPGPQIFGFGDPTHEEGRGFCEFCDALEEAADAAECTCDADPLGVCPVHGGTENPDTWNACLEDALQDCEDSRPKKTRYR